MHQTTLQVMPISWIKFKHLPLLFVFFCMTACHHLSPKGESNDDRVVIPQVEEAAELDWELQQAIDQLVARIQRENSYGDSYLELAKIYYSNGLRRLAERALSVYTEHCLNDGKAWYFLARVSHGLGDIAQAETALQRTIDLCPDYMPAHWHLARIQLELGDPEAAIDRTGHVMRQLPHDEQNLLIRAQAFLEADQHRDAGQLLDSHSFRDSDNAKYARFLRTLAQRHTERLGNSNPSEIAPSQPTWSDSWYAELSSREIGFASKRVRAQKLYQHGQIHEALELCKTLIDDSRADSREWNLLGMCYFILGKQEEAIQAMQMGLERFPTDFNLHLNLANIFLSSSGIHFSASFKQAIPLLERATDLCPDQWEPWMGLGQIAHSQGNIKQALTYYEQACSLARSVQKCTWFRIFALLDLGRIADVNLVLDQLPRSEQDSPYFLFARAAVMKSQGKIETAEDLLAQATNQPIDDDELSRRIELLRFTLNVTK